MPAEGSSREARASHFTEPDVVLVCSFALLQIGYGLRQFGAGARDVEGGDFGTAALVNN
jgi:hypothetical protein